MKMEDHMEVLREVFGKSSSDSEELDPQLNNKQIADPMPSWEEIKEINGLWLCRDFLSPQNQYSLVSSVLKEGWLNEDSHNQGNQSYKDKQWQKAIGFYTEAIKLSGNNATYYSNRAASYLELGSFLQAEAYCTKVINLDKKNVKAYLRRGTAREMLGYYKEAIEGLR